MEILVLPQHGVDIAIQSYLGMVLDAGTQTEECFTRQLVFTEFECHPFESGARKAETVEADLIEVRHVGRSIGSNSKVRSLRRGVG